MFDFVPSTLDPVFFLHHGQIDGLWAAWQAGEMTPRWTSDGTASIFNGAGTPEVSHGTMLEWGLG
jgi:tyrosinase